MSSLGIPVIYQGSLNRILTSVQVPSYPQLNLTAPYMSKAMITPSFDGPFTDQIGTATGIVNSPLPYVMGTLVISILRSQAVSGLWILQAQTASVIGTITAYPDSTAYPSITLGSTASPCSITDYDPGTYDGTDPTVKVTVKGVFYTNATLWTAAAS
jgi:hypothetical protein